jgi:hypothetical protein
LSSAALIIALLAPTTLHVAAPSSVHPAAIVAESPKAARLVLWGTQVRWDDHWRAYVTHEVPDRAVAPVWERFETPSADAGGAAPSFIVMREMDCG